MASLDDRIVSMSFDNKNFETNVGQSLSTLDKLKKALTFGGNKKNGLDDLQASAGRFSLGNINTQIQGASAKFLSLSTIGITALATLTTKAVSAGLAITKSLTLAPVLDGFQQYTQQINATQTILANTAQTGGTLDSVTKTLATLNDYANKTIFNFSDMATNLGTFTSAGVKLPEAASAIKGLSNVAAAAGAGTQQAAGAMYQLSQALGRGKLQAQDWNSVVAAGMASSNFKNALLETAKAMGTIKMPATQTIDQWVKAGGSFQDAMAKGEITSGVLTQTLGAMTGDLTDAQLAAQGYSAEQIKSIQAMAKQASLAAVNVKTAKAVMDNLSQGVGSSWAAVFKTIVGDLPQATKLFTGISQSLNKIFVSPIDNLNKLLTGVAKLGGRNILISGVTDAFKALGAIIKPIKDAFGQIFPPASAKSILSILQSFQKFTANLIIGKSTADLIKRTFAGLFAALDIGKTIIGGLIKIVANLFGQFSGAGTGILGVTASFGDFVVKVDKALKSGTGFQTFIEKLSAILAAPIKLLKQVGQYVAGIFKSWKQKDADDVSDSFQRIHDRLDPLQKLLGVASGAWDKFITLISKAKQLVQPGLDAIANAFSNLGTAIGTALSSGNFSGVLDVINTGLLGGILLLVKKFFSNGIKVDVGGGFLDSIKEGFEGLTGQLKAMQTSVKADTLLKIAGAVALLVASISILSLIDSDKLTKAMAGLGVAMAELMGGMLILTKVTRTAGFLKLPFVAASLVLLAGALLILTASVKVLSTMSWEELTKGLVGVGVLLGIISAAVIPLSANSEGMVAAGVGITAIAIGLRILVGVVEQLGKMDLKTMAQGMGGIALALVAIGGASRVFPKNMVAIGVGLLAIGLALKVIAQDISTFAAFNYETMAKGIGGIAAALVAIGLAMKLMGGPAMIAQAAGLVILAGALKLIAGVISTLGNMRWEVIGKGIAAIAASLAVLAAGMYVMEGALPGAAALLVAAGALAILAPVLKTLGNMSWESIAKGLVAIAGTFVIIGAAGLLLTPVIPSIVALSVALGLLGVGIALIGVGALALATAFSIMATVGTAGIAVFSSAIIAFLQLVPTIATTLANALVQIIVVIGNSAPKIAKAFVQIAGSILDALNQLIPKVGAVITTLLQTILGVITANVPSIIAAGLLILTSLLQGIANNIGQVVTSVGDIIVNFLNALSTQLPRIIAAGLNLLINFLQGIANGLSRVITAGVSIVTSVLDGIANGVTRIVNAGANIIVNLLTGLARNVGRVISAGTDAIANFITGLGQNGAKIAEAAFTAVITFLNGLTLAIDENSYAIGQAAGKLGIAIVQGIIEGMAGMAGALKDKVVGMAGDALSWFGGKLGIHSPSKEFMKMGEYMVQGAVLGVDNKADNLNDSVGSMAENAIATMTKTIANMPDIISDNINTSPVITPVLDLTNVTKDASKIPGLLSTASVVPSVSNESAGLISASKMEGSVNEIDPGDTGAAAQQVIFQQTNTSPKALDAATIYRNTKSQIALAKKYMDADAAKAEDKANH